MSADNIKKKIEPSYDFQRVAAIAQDDPGFTFPCLVKMNSDTAQLPAGVHANSAIGPFRTCQITYEQMQKMADCPEVLSFTFR